MYLWFNMIAVYLTELQLKIANICYKSSRRFSNARQALIFLLTSRKRNVKTKSKNSKTRDTNFLIRKGFKARRGLEFFLI